VIPAVGPVVVSWCSGGDTIAWEFDAAGGYAYTVDRNVTIVRGKFGGAQSIVGTVASILCRVEDEPGHHICVVRLNQAPLSDYYFSVHIPEPFLGPTFALVAAGSTEVSFPVTGPSNYPVGMAPQFTAPGRVWVLATGKLSDWYADIMAPYVEVR
jgi:hypothetical protein